MFGSILGAVAPSLIGGLLGSGGSNNGSTQKQELDPRMQTLLYGSDGSGGLLGDTSNLYRRQSATGGLNPLQLAGLEGQRQFLADPGYSQGYGAMRDLGMGLLGGGVASNPFTRGRAPGVGAAPTSPRQAQYQPFNYAGNPTLAASWQNPVQGLPSMQAPPAAESEAEKLRKQQEVLMQMMGGYSGYSEGA